MWPFKNKKKKSLFSIEYYPYSKKYYAKYGNNYLKHNSSTGIVTLEPPKYFIFATECSSEERARIIIDLFKEQQLKENIQIIPVD